MRCALALLLVACGTMPASPDADLMDAGAADRTPITPGWEDLAKPHSDVDQLGVDMTDDRDFSAPPDLTFVRDLVPAIPPDMTSLPDLTTDLTTPPDIVQTCVPSGAGCSLNGLACCNGFACTGLGCCREKPGESCTTARDCCGAYFAGRGACGGAGCYKF